MRLPIVPALALVVVLLAVPAIGLLWLRHSLDAPLPDVKSAAADLVSVLSDTTPVTIVFTVNGEQRPYVTTADDIRLNVTLWRRMHLADWNTVPEPFLREGLERMLTRYRPILMNPRAWDRMTAADWDACHSRCGPWRTDRWWPIGPVTTTWATSTEFPPGFVAGHPGGDRDVGVWFDHRGLLVNPMAAGISGWAAPPTTPAAVSGAA